MMLLCACSSQGDKPTKSGANSMEEVTVKYATGFSVRDSADIRLVDVGKKDHFALVHDADAVVPEGYVKVKVPIERTICMTSLQLSISPSSMPTISLRALPVQRTSSTRISRRV